MSILDMDVTTRRDAGSVRTREFATVRKGYDPDQVRSYLDQLSAWIEDLQTDLAEARAEATMAARTARAEPAPAPAPPQEDPYAALGSRVAEVIRSAEEHAQRAQQEADTAAERMVEEARQEALHIRRRAQEDSEALRQAAEDQAEVTRRTAQEEADRVRNEAANALESARVEAERTVSSLAERRNVLAAELHATRTRLLGIVTRLEEDHAAEPVAEGIWPAAEAEVEAGDAGDSGAEPEPIGIPRLGSIPSDDPRRDPVPSDLPAFVPPPAPVRTPLLRGEFIESIEFPVPSDVAPDPEPAGDIVHLEGEAAAPPVAAPEPVAEPAPPVEADEAGWRPEAAAEPLTDVAIPEPPPEAAIEAAPAAEGDAPEQAGATADEDQSSFLQWTPEEKDDMAGIDLTLPEFPSIDIPSLNENDERRKP